MDIQKPHRLGWGLAWVFMGNLEFFSGEIGNFTQFLFNAY